MPPSSSGLGHLPFTEAAAIRIRLGVPFKKEVIKPLFFCVFLFFTQIKNYTFFLDLVDFLGFEVTAISSAYFSGSVFDS